jgi:hypothetical protein
MRGFSASRIPSDAGFFYVFQAAFFTRPERMQSVQTRMCFRAPLTTALTRRRLGFQRRRVTLWAWLIVFPKLGFLPQSSQTNAIVA